MIKLKGGHTTSDPRLDRIPTWDDRNEKFPIKTILSPVAYAKPRSYRWRVPFRFNQGHEGRCVEYALVHELAARPVQIAEDRLLQILAGREIYWPAQEQDQWPGGSYPGASPQYEGTSVLSGVGVATQLGFYSEYRWALNLDDLVAALGYKGPAVLGINWYDSMFSPDSQGFISVSGRIAGGHAILCRGVNIKLEYVELVQSWGTWGLSDSFGPGICKVRFSDLERLISEDAEVCIPVHRTKPK